jgi:hypothetical protein
MFNEMCKDKSNGITIPDGMMDGDFTMTLISESFDPCCDMNKHIVVTHSR